MFFGACDGNFYCLDKVIGKLEGKAANLQRVDSDPIHHDGRIYFACTEDWLHCVSADAGEVIWKKQIVGCGYGNPLFHNSQVLIAAANELASVKNNCRNFGCSNAY